MKLGEILYEAGTDASRDMADSKHIDAEDNTENYEVDFELFDEDGEEISIPNSSDAENYPEVVEIEVSGFDILSANENNYEFATATLTPSSEKDIEKWLKTRSDYVEVTDYEFDIDFNKQSGKVTATALKDDVDDGN